jgi:hypothetical protein
MEESSRSDPKTPIWVLSRAATAAAPSAKVAVVRARVGFRTEPIWAENYYGYILRPDLIDAARAGATITAALSAMCQEAFPGRL